MKKILIIAAEEPILKMYSATLTDKYQVVTAKDGESGIETARKEKPDLIYLDIIMPHLNGLDVLKKLKENKETQNIPVILLTNLPKEASADKATSLGARDYFVKVDNTPERIAEKTNQIFSQTTRPA